MTARLTEEMKNTDFQPRDRFGLTLTPILYCTVAFLAVVAIDFAFGDVQHKAAFIIIMALIMADLCLLLVFLAKQNRDLVMFTELQNSILASAAQLNLRFCLIVDHAGTVTYMDRGFQQFFHHSARNNIRNIQGVFLTMGATTEAENTILKAMKSGRSERVLCTLKDAEGKSFPLMIMVDMLPRPKGFFLIRGRDYVAKRKTFTAETEANGTVLLSRVLDSLSEGVIVTQTQGNILYTNRTIEKWLGYDEGELTAAPLSLRQIIYQYGEEKAGQLIEGDYVGEVKLLRKDRTLLRLRIQQTSISENHAVIGINAVFNQVAN